MGVYFKVVKINTTKVHGRTVSKVEVDSNAIQPTPLMSITKLDRTGTAKKVAIPYIDASRKYTTSWIPIAQEGWVVKLQAMLKYEETIPTVDNIRSWLRIDSGQLLTVASNQSDRYGRLAASVLPIEKLPNGTTWYIDKITITARKGYTHIADMEMTLYIYNPPVGTT